MSRQSDAMVAFLLGAAAGSITALLLAPEKGEVTRRRLREGGGRVVEQGREAVTRVATAMEEAAREKGRVVGEAARHQVNAVRGAVSGARDGYRRELDKS